VEIAADTETETETEAEIDGDYVEETVVPPKPKEGPTDLTLETFDIDAYPESAKKKPKQKWSEFKDGVRGLLVWDFFDSRLTIRAHARIQVDGTVAKADEKMESFYGEFDNSFDLRRVQLFAQGTIDHHLRYSVSFAAGADPGFGEVFVEGRDDGLNIFGYRIGQFRAGSFQEPFSFERVASSYYTGFLERSLPVWAFSPGNNIGYMVHDTTKNGRLSWAVGFFSFGQTNEENASNSVLSLTSRVTALPVYKDEGRTLLHVGGSFSNRDPKGSSLRYRSRPEARFVPFLVDTGDFSAGRVRLYGAEVVAVKGPVSVQAEGIMSRAAGTEFGNLEFWGGYAEVGWFLTGEHRAYDEQLGVFSRVVPKEEHQGFFKKRQGGALELAGRISYLDLNSQDVNGGTMLNLTFGVNWYLSGTSALRLNYIHTVVEDRGHGNILVLRYQFRPLPVPGWR
jgi:phosphate-selective porin OprO/OprP